MSAVGRSRAAYGRGVPSTPWSLRGRRVHDRSGALKTTVTVGPPPCADPGCAPIRHFTRPSLRTRTVLPRRRRHAQQRDVRAHLGSDSDGLGGRRETTSSSSSGCRRRQRRPHLAVSPSRSQYHDGGGRARNASLYGGGCVDYGAAGGSSCKFGDTDATARAQLPGSDCPVTRLRTSSTQNRAAARQRPNASA